MATQRLEPGRGDWDGDELDLELRERLQEEGIDSERLLHVLGVAFWVSLLIAVPTLIWVATLYARGLVPWVW